MMIGKAASEMIAAAWRTFSAGGAGGSARWTSSGCLSWISLPAMFSGKSMKLTPGFSASAILKALRTISGITSGSRIWTLYLVIGRNRLTRSRCWWLSLCMRVVAAWPAMATTGA